MEEISPIQFFKLYQTNRIIKIIDIREMRDFDTYHIYSSINIPYKLLIDKHKLFLNKHQTYYIICKNGSRSYYVSKYLTRLGYNVINVIGGIDSFKGSVVTNIS